MLVTQYQADKELKQMIASNDVIYSAVLYFTIDEDKKLKYQDSYRHIENYGTDDSSDKKYSLSVNEYSNGIDIDFDTGIAGKSKSVSIGDNIIYSANSAEVRIKAQTQNRQTKMDVDGTVDIPLSAKNIFIQIVFGGNLGDLPYISAFEADCVSEDGTFKWLDVANCIATDWYNFDTLRENLKTMLYYINSVTTKFGKTNIVTTVIQDYQSLSFVKESFYKNYLHEISDTKQENGKTITTKHNIRTGITSVKTSEVLTECDGEEISITLKDDTPIFSISEKISPNDSENTLCVITNENRTRMGWTFQKVITKTFMKSGKIKWISINDSFAETLTIYYNPDDSISLDASRSYFKCVITKNDNDEYDTILYQYAPHEKEKSFSIVTVKSSSNNELVLESYLKKRKSDSGDTINYLFNNIMPIPLLKVNITDPATKYTTVYDSDEGNISNGSVRELFYHKVIGIDSIYNDCYFIKDLPICSITKINDEKVIIDDAFETVTVDYRESTVTTVSKTNGNTVVESFEEAGPIYTVDQFMMTHTFIPNTLGIMTEF